MKIKVTQKQIRSGYTRIIKVGYCDLQHMLTYEEPIYYTAGTYGWSADIYEVDAQTAIVTGYTPFGNIKPEYEMMRKYDRKAEEIICTVHQYEDAREALKDLTMEFVKEVYENG